MAHWFHRNPIKVTDEVKFELKSVLTSVESKKICGDLCVRRQRILEHFLNASNELETVDEEFSKYLALFAGFIAPIGSSGTEHETASKLAPLIRFRWTNSMLGLTAMELSESWFEALNMVLNMALWLTKHAAWTAAKDEVREGEAKRVHTCLRRAAGMFQFVLQNTDKVSGASSVSGSDFDPAVLRAYIQQCTAEAQEVTVARAIELKHSPGLISALAHETSQLFTKAENSLETLDDSIFGKWRHYLQLKAQFYLAYAYAFLGESLLAEDKCGEAIRACKEGISYYQVAADFAVKYAKAPGPGKQAHPEKHLFFRKIEPLLKRHLEKAERENSLIYHQKVVEDCPCLEEKATYGLAKAEPFTLPSPHQDWNASVYASFNIAKAKMPDFSKIKKSSRQLAPVHEEEVYETDREPANSSGCVLS
uniref:BRO1 domain-containing protein n=1 Tax=Parascaris univalens TaxID=6257 RepID=A0A914ZKY9_PARUN